MTGTQHIFDAFFVATGSAGLAERAVSCGIAIACLDLWHAPVNRRFSEPANAQGHPHVECPSGKETVSAPQIVQLDINSQAPGANVSTPAACCNACKQNVEVGT